MSLLSRDRGHFSDWVWGRSPIGLRNGPKVLRFGFEDGGGEFDAA